MADADKEVKMSQFLSLILRHKPEEIGLTLDQHGWADISELLLKAKHTGLNDTLLREIVASSDKQRFALSPDGKKIRANQGHSLEINLQLSPQSPPEWLYHGTAHRHKESILKEGLLKRERQHVHLSEEPETALHVGKRYDRHPVLLKIAATEMEKKGHLFFQSANGVWLSEHIPPEFIQICEPNHES